MRTLYHIPAFSAIDKALISSSVEEKHYLLSGIKFLLHKTFKLCAEHCTIAFFHFIAQIHHINIGYCGISGSVIKTV